MYKYSYKGCIITVFTLLYVVGCLHKPFAQDGTFFITTYGQEITHAPKHNYQITQIPNGEMMAANHLGLLKFNGKYWNLSKWLDENRRMLEVTKILPEQNKTFIGATHQIGFLKKERGRFHYKTMFTGEYSRELTYPLIKQGLAFVFALISNNLAKVVATA